MNRSSLVTLACLGALAGSAAWGQEAIPTAAHSGAGAPPAPAATARPTLISDRDRDHDDRGPVPIGPCGLPYRDDGHGGLKQDKDIHGEVWGAIGTHGYREAGGAVCIPAGHNAEVNLAVDAGRIDSPRWNWR